jgi:exodeoxyribonuclease-5
LQLTRALRRALPLRRDNAMTANRTKREASAVAWSAQQDAALKAVSAWLKRGEPQVFRLFGYAGSGKTTLARAIAEDSGDDILFGAYTGKAALVMRSKGCKDARTIHSLIYRARDSDSEEPIFELNEDGPAARARLIIIDECSMVDSELGRDLLSFGKPVLVLGDPAQLPPVKGGGYFTEGEPDAMLTEVHRQAADNPIIKLSILIRAGGRLSAGTFGESRVVHRDLIDAEAVSAADQILVGLNRTRRAYNKRMRELLGRGGAFPEPGDKLVCLRNDRKKGLLNGSLWTVSTTGSTRRKKLRLSVVPEDDGSRKPLRIGVLPAFFTGEDEIPYAQRRDSDEFDYGYALTVHKAQGSQWNDVMLFDESGAFREHRNRWLYTGITRAVERLTIVL